LRQDTIFYGESNLNTVEFMDGVKIDSNYFYKNDKVKSISSFRNNVKHGISIFYLETKPQISRIEYYVNGEKHGPSIQYDFNGEIYSCSYYLFDELIIERNMSPNQSLAIFLSNGVNNIEWDSRGNLISFHCTLGVDFEFYPNGRMKSTTISPQYLVDSTLVTHFAFHEEGTLQAEGSYIDTLIPKMDTMITLITEVEEYVSVKVTYSRPPKGIWYYYSTKGILEEKKYY
jgi:antitoxin component YwqK of YwqJK toxin-antitoxin module